MRRRFTSRIGSAFDESFDVDNYLTIEALEDDFSIYFTGEIEYGIDGKGWSVLKEGLKSPTINSGQTLSFKGELIPDGRYGIGSFLISKKCNLKGNCMSMVFGDNAADNFSLSGYSNVFWRLFYNVTGIISISKNFLPATTLASNCYENMFYGCTSLVSAPELPATTLAEYCYSYMFYGCTSLVSAPELPATTLAEYCYSYMFRGCTNLNYIKMLATNISADYCLINWVYGVFPTGTFVKNKDATWDVVGNSGVPTGWLVVNDDVNLITFTLGGKTYVAEKGMTCSEWMETKYNIDNQYGFLYQDGSAVKPSDILIEEYNYKQEEA